MWKATVDGRTYTLDDCAMARYLTDLYRDHHEDIGDAFAEWVNESYTPWDAMNTDMDDALGIWAKEMVGCRQDRVLELVPRLNWEVTE